MPELENAFTWLEKRGMREVHYFTALVNQQKLQGPAESNWCIVHFVVFAFRSVNESESSRIILMSAF